MASHRVEVMVYREQRYIPYGNTRHTIFERSDGLRRSADAGTSDGGVFWTFQCGEIECHQCVDTAQGHGSVEFATRSDDRGKLFPRRRALAFGGYAGIRLCATREVTDGKDREAPFLVRRSAGGTDRSGGGRHRCRDRATGLGPRDDRGTA